MTKTAPTTLHSLETLKAWMRIQGVDQTEDDRLVIAANGATSEIERELDVYFVQRSVTEQVSGDGRFARALQYAPVVSIDSFVMDGAPVSPTLYALDAGRGILRFTSGAFTGGVQNVLLTYTAGYDVQDGSNLPADIYRAALDLTKAIYDELSAGAIAATSVSLGGATMVIKAAKRPPSVQRVIDSWDGAGARP